MGCTNTTTPPLFSLSLVFPEYLSPLPPPRGGEVPLPRDQILTASPKRQERGRSRAVVKKYDWTLGLTWTSLSKRTNPHALQKRLTGWGRGERARRGVGQVWGQSAYTRDGQCARRGEGQRAWRGGQRTKRWAAHREAGAARARRAWGGKRANAIVR